MPEEIMIISVVAIIFGTGLLALVLTGIYKLIKAKIDQGKQESGQINPQFFKALGEFKKNTERRLSVIEEKVSDIEEDHYRIDEKAESTGDIEIEDEEVRTADSKDKSDNNLRNMLNE